MIRLRNVWRFLFTEVISTGKKYPHSSAFHDTRPNHLHADHDLTNRDIIASRNALHALTDIRRALQSLQNPALESNRHRAEGRVPRTPCSKSSAGVGAPTPPPHRAAGLQTCRGSCLILCQLSSSFSIEVFIYNLRSN